MEPNDGLYGLDPIMGGDPDIWYGGRAAELAAMYPGLAAGEVRARGNLNGDMFGQYCRWFARYHTMNSGQPAYLCRLWGTYTASKSFKMPVCLDTFMT